MYVMLFSKIRDAYWANVRSGICILLTIIYIITWSDILLYITLISWFIWVYFCISTDKYVTRKTIRW